MSRPHSSSVDADNAWGKPVTPTSEPATLERETFDASDVVEKERLVRDILSKQDGLRALLQRVSEVQGEATKLKSDNETLQTYIDNLTRNKYVMTLLPAKSATLS
ncbi:Slo1p [Sporobolomyces koalae]|uniref:Slo1p n=1 Tax=Sporobolomyces koalae TaxID=500713 RepID=UPI00316C1066